MKAYTGVGSRETPEDVLELMKKVARKLAELGWTLRSGAADGADQAFEAGCDEVEGEKEIFIAWEGFCGRKQGVNGVVPLLDCKERLAFQLASEIHPAWSACAQGAKALHARNCYQVLGKDLLTPSKMVIAWAQLTKAGEPKGGTATAINLAKRQCIKVFNLYNEEDRDRVELFIKH